MRSMLNISTPRMQRIPDHWDGIIPPLIPGVVNVLPGPPSYSSLNMDFLTPEAQLDLSTSLEYRSLLHRLDLVDEGVLARPTQFGNREALPHAGDAMAGPCVFADLRREGGGPRVRDLPHRYLKSEP